LTLPNLHYSLKYYFKFYYVCILTFGFGYDGMYETSYGYCSSEVL